MLCLCTLFYMYIMYYIMEHSMDCYMLCLCTLLYMYHNIMYIIWIIIRLYLIVYVLQSNVIPFRKPIRFRWFIYRYFKG